MKSISILQDELLSLIRHGEDSQVDIRKQSLNFLRVYLILSAHFLTEKVAIFFWVCMIVE